MEGYLNYIREHFQKDIQEMEEYFPVICGEWCLFNSLACGWDTKGGQSVLNGLDGEVESSVSDEEKKKSIRQWQKRSLRHGIQEARNVLTDFNSKVIMGCQRKRERHLVI